MRLTSSQDQAWSWSRTSCSNSVSRGGDQKDADAVGNDSARVHHDVGANGPEKLLVIFVILPHHDKEIGVEGPGRHDNGEVVGIVVGAHHQTHGAPHARLFQCMGLGTPP